MRIVKGSALILSAALCAALLAGCMRGGSSSAAPTPSASPAATAAPAPSATPETATGESSAGYTAAGLQTALESCLAYGAGSAGASLKAAIAAGDLVRYTAQYGKGNAETIAADAQAWYDRLDAGKQAQLQENWPAIRDTARAITDDPEQARGLLESAGVRTDFSSVDLETAAASLTALGGVFQPQQAG